jgi:hypothetical protein
MVPMRMIDQLALLRLNLDVLRGRQFAQRAAAYMVFECHPRRDVVKYLSKTFPAEGDYTTALLFFPAALLLLTHRHLNFQLWVATPRFVRFFENFESPLQPERRQTPLFVADANGLAIHGDGQAVDAAGYLQTYLERLTTVIFIIDQTSREEELGALLQRVVASDANVLLILPDQFAAQIADTLKPNLSFPMTWDPPLTLHYRSRWLPRAEGVG